jgi:hypothetical protein
MLGALPALLVVYIGKTAHVADDECIAALLKDAPTGKVVQLSGDGFTMSADAARELGMVWPGSQHGGVTVHAGLLGKPQ